MIEHEVRVHPSAGYRLPRAEQLAWKIAEVAADPVEPHRVAEMVVNRVIDNAAVAAAALDRSRSRARAQALAHPFSPGAPVLGARHPPRLARVGGLGQRRRRARARLPRHLPRRRLLAPRRQHPADAGGRPALRAVRRATWSAASRRLRDPGRPGARRSACTSTRSTTSPTSARRPRPASARCSACRRRSSTRPSARRCTSPPPPASPARARSRAGRPTRRPSPGRSPSRRSTGRCAASARRRHLRGRGRRDRLAARRPGAAYAGAAAGARRAQARRSCATYTKEHSAEYQSQALIDLARRMAPAHRRPRRRCATIVIHTSHHTHNVIGTGANDPQKMDPAGQPRDARPLDHVHLRGRARRTAPGTTSAPTPPSAPPGPTRSRCGTRICTVEDPEWTRRYHATDPDGRRSAAGWWSRSTTARSSRTSSPWPTRTRSGARPFARAQYVEKFRTLAEGVVAAAEQERFLAVAERLPSCAPDQLGRLTVTADGDPDSRRPERDLLMMSPCAVTGARRQARRLPGRAGLAAGCCGCPARSRRWSRC